VSFTSVGGGIGRTVTLANIAWMLASTGNRVLAIDWNFRAPHLLEMFHPFWGGGDLRQGFGVIDVLWDFLALHRRRRGFGSPANECHPSEQYDAVMSKARPLSWDFPGNGRLNVIGVGYPPTYALRRKLFPFDEFFGQAAGTDFLSAIRTALVQLYDYVLIDSPPLIDDAGLVINGSIADIVCLCFSPPAVELTAMSRDRLVSAF
jgi:hypothetical protein